MLWLGYAGGHEGRLKLVGRLGAAGRIDRLLDLAGRHRPQEEGQQQNDDQRGGDYDVAVHCGTFEMTA